MVFALFDLVSLLPIAVFGAFAAGAWWMMDMLSSRKPRVEERLDVLKDPRKAGANGGKRQERRCDGRTCLKKQRPSFRNL